MEVDTCVVVCWTIVSSSCVVSTEDKSGFMKFHLSVYFMFYNYFYIEVDYIGYRSTYFGGDMKVFLFMVNAEMCVDEC